MDWKENREIREEIESLIAEYRDSCLWFMKKDISPVSAEDILHILEHIEKHGDKDGFVRARKVKEWLLQNSSVPSAE